ncbi:MAG: 3'-5' exonuclease [Muribaculaceae bacterium]|nr:3'-5' exonuclease [Muribaculaceae bacterium]
MKLKLTRPLVFFDLETTGTNVGRDRIVEISLVKLFPDGTTTEKTRRINPEMPIPAEATAIHHITDEDVASEPTFRQIARSLADVFRGCDIAGFNSNRFDLPMLDYEFDRAGVDFDFSKARFIDVQTIFHKKEPRTLVAAYKYYCGAELVGAHGALADTRATMEVLLAQLDHYEDLPDEVGGLSSFATANRNVDIAGRIILDDKDREVFNFGQHKGKTVAEVLRTQPAYGNWILNGDFAPDTKRVIRRLMLRGQLESKK